ncbi:MAG: AAA family ATPase [Bacteroidaceae bacterium]|nr:AAA family ATPase [Bacteroidaceae bacterium]
MENALLPIQRLRTLLEMERDAEREEYRVQSEQMSLERKVRRGICWWPLTVGRSYYNSLNLLVVEVMKTTDDDIDHSFEYGRPVIFFTHSSYPSQPSRLFSYQCTISYVEDTRMVVVLPSTQALIDIQSAENLGVQLYFDETSYRTMFHALDDVLSAKKGRLVELRDIFAGQQKAEKFTFQPMRFPWLNPTQEQAVNEVLWAKDVAVVHGPPGTGKTTTLVEAIYETLHRETQVIVCAQSNMAVDWISEKLVDHGVPVLRIGNPTRVNDKMLSFTYERRFESHPDYTELWSIRKAIRDIREKKNKGESTHQKIARLRERAQELEMRIHESLMNEARVVACTLVGSANKILVGQKFSTLFIDEAAQALEPACWIAIRRAHRVVFAGDHQQLPATVKCYEAQKQGLGKTLMERIVENVPSAVTLLRVQYRMHEQIMRFSSDWFYEGKVESAPMVKYRSILDWDTPMVWVDTACQTHPLPLPCREGCGHPKQQFSNSISEKVSTPLPTREGQGGGSSHGYINQPEAELTVSVLEQYIEKIGRQRYVDERFDVGIITPYRLQAQYLRSLLKKNETLRPIRKTISVNTVDGFQGQERDIVLISLVRSNEHGQIGFLNDLRRMNVAMTRARMKLIIIGDSETLSHHPFYHKLKAYVDGL